jgi:hypothetical protein
MQRKEPFAAIETTYKIFIVCSNNSSLRFVNSSFFRILELQQQYSELSECILHFNFKILNIHKIFFGMFVLSSKAELYNIITSQY